MAHPLGVRLERRRSGRASPSAVDDGGGVGDGLRDRHGPVAWRWRGRCGGRRTPRAPSATTHEDHARPAPAARAPGGRPRAPACRPLRMAGHCAAPGRARRVAVNSTNTTVTAVTRTPTMAGTEPGRPRPAARPGGTDDARPPHPDAPRQQRRDEPHPLPLRRGDRRGRPRHRWSGCVAPDFAVELKPLGTAFVALIKMMIQPVIFCTIVHRRRLGRAAPPGSARSAASRSAYFLVDVDGRAGHRPGRRQHPAPRLGPAPDRRRSPARRRGPGRRAPAPRRTSCSGIIPTSLFSALTSGEVLQTLLVALLVGFALQAMGRAGEPILRGDRPPAARWSSGSWR